MALVAVSIIKILGLVMQHKKYTNAVERMGIVGMILPEAHLYLLQKYTEPQENHVKVITRGQLIPPSHDIMNVFVTVNKK
jgi:hypothetical protein